MINPELLFAGIPHSSPRYCFWEKKIQSEKHIFA